MRRSLLPDCTPLLPLTPTPPRFECFLLKSVRHPNVVKFVGICWDAKMFGLCLEFVSNGTLGDWLAKTCKPERRKELLWKKHLLSLCVQCAAGVEYLHNERYWDDTKGWQECIIHRDLKPDNLLLTDEWLLKLTDFGEARATQDNTMTSVGSPVYIAPEVLRGDRYDSKCDVYVRERERSESEE